MNEQQLAAVKQALEALKRADSRDGYLTYITEIEALQSIISQDALYKMAEDAVTIGLSYNDWPKIGCVNHDCDQCRAVQEPVAWGIIASNTGRICQVELEADEVEGHNPKHIVPLYTAPQPVPVKTYHDGKPNLGVKINDRNPTTVVAGLWHGVWPDRGLGVVGREAQMKAIYTSDNTEQIVERQDDIAEVTTGHGYAWPGETTCRVQNTGNGYIAYFPAPNCTRQDYYVCLDYSQARDLILGLSMFKKELGFKDE